MLRNQFIRDFADLLPRTGHAAQETLRGNVGFKSFEMSLVLLSDS